MQSNKQEKEIAMSGEGWSEKELAMKEQNEERLEKSSCGCNVRTEEEIKTKEMCCSTNRGEDCEKYDIKGVVQSELIYMSQDKEKQKREVQQREKKSCIKNIDLDKVDSKERQREYTDCENSSEKFKIEENNQISPMPLKRRRDSEGKGDIENIDFRTENDEPYFFRKRRRSDKQETNEERKRSYDKTKNLVTIRQQKEHQGNLESEEILTVYCDDSSKDLIKRDSKEREREIIECQEVKKYNENETYGNEIFIPFKKVRKEIKCNINMVEGDEITVEEREQTIEVNFTGPQIRNNEGRKQTKREKKEVEMESKQVNDNSKHFKISIKHECCSSKGKKEDSIGLPEVKAIEEGSEDNIPVSCREENTSTGIENTNTGKENKGNICNTLQIIDINSERTGSDLKEVGNVYNTMETKGNKNENENTKENSISKVKEIGENKEEEAGNKFEVEEAEENKEENESEGMEEENSEVKEAKEYKEKNEGETKEEGNNSEVKETEEKQEKNEGGTKKEGNESEVKETEENKENEVEQDEEGNKSEVKETEEKEEGQGEVKEEGIKSELKKTKESRKRNEDKAKEEKNKSPVKEPEENMEENECEGKEEGIKSEVKETEEKKKENEGEGEGEGEGEAQEEGSKSEVKETKKNEGKNEDVITEDENVPEKKESEGVKEESVPKIPLIPSVLNNFKPSTWSCMSPGREVELVTLSSFSSEYTSMKSKIESTLSLTIDKVVRVQNPYLWGCFLLKKAEYESRRGSCVEEMELFHATGQENIQSITEYNLDWRRSERTKFGQGVSFSSRAGYANTYCSKKVGSNRALILAKVLVGQSGLGGYVTEIPPLSIDTTTGRCGAVYVKYCDNEFYPDYVVYYKNEYAKDLWKKPGRFLFI